MIPRLLFSKKNPSLLKCKDKNYGSKYPDCFKKILQAGSLTQKNERGCLSEEFLEFLGYVMLNIPIRKNQYCWLCDEIGENRIDSFSVYSMYKGLISTFQVQHSLNYALYLLSEKIVDWFVISVFGVEDSPVAFSNFPHIYDMCGDNNLYICCFLDGEKLKCLFICEINATDRSSI